MEITVEHKALSKEEQRYYSLREAKMENIQLSSWLFISLAERAAALAVQDY